MIKIDFIENIDENDKPFQEQLDCLLEAIFNWDEKLIFLDDYLKSIKEFLNGSLKRNKCNIRDVLKRKNSVKTAWKMESISVLIRLLDDNDQLLENILEDIIVRIVNYTDLQSPASASKNNIKS